MNTVTRSRRSTLVRTLARWVKGWAESVLKEAEDVEKPCPPPAPAPPGPGAAAPPEHWRRLVESRRRGPPADWVERVRQGAPHLLERLDVEPPAPVARTGPAAPSRPHLRMPAVGAAPPVPPLASPPGDIAYLPVPPPVPQARASGAFPAVRSAPTPVSTPRPRADSGVQWARVARDGGPKGPMLGPPPRLEEPSAASVARPSRALRLQPLPETPPRPSGALPAVQAPPPAAPRTPPAPPPPGQVLAGEVSAPRPSSPDVAYLSEPSRPSWPEPPTLPSHETQEPLAVLRDWERLRRLEREQRGE